MSNSEKIPERSTEPSEEGSGPFTMEPRTPLEEALNVLAIAMRSEYGPRDTAARLRAEAEKIDGYQTEDGVRIGGLNLSEISPWEGIMWRVVHQPRWVERQKSEDEEHTPSNPEPDHPKADELGDTIRACPMIPPELVEYVAGVLEGTQRRPKGRPRQRPEAQHARITGIRYDVWQRAAGFKLQGLNKPTQRAIEAVAKAINRATSTVERIIYKEFPKIPNSYSVWRSSEEEMLETVRIMQSEGEIELDPDDGIRWLDGN